MEFNNNSGASSFMGDYFLFDPAILKRLSWRNHRGSYAQAISHLSPGDGLLLRPLAISDYQKGYMELLSQLTSVGVVTKEQFENQFKSMKSTPATYYVCVVEDMKMRKIVGSATLVLEKKFIHGCGARGRIEDVVVNSNYRKQQLGKLLVDVLTLLGSEELHCYKVSLECKDSLLGFYGGFGYARDEGNNFLVQRFDGPQKMQSAL